MGPEMKDRCSRDPLRQRGLWGPDNGGVEGGPGEGEVMTASLPTMPRGGRTSLALGGPGRLTGTATPSKGCSAGRGPE